MRGRRQACVLLLLVGGLIAFLPRLGWGEGTDAVDRRGWGASSRLGAGALLLHSPKLVLFRESPPYELSLAWVVEADGSEEYAQFWGYPLYRLGYQYMNLGSDRFLGSAHTLYASVQFFPFRYGRFSLELDVATGLAFVPQAYGPVRNPYNSAVGSVLNAFLSAGVGVGARIGSRSSVSLGGRFSHVSNGTIARPNLGLNFFLLSVGYNQFLGSLPSSASAGKRGAREGAHAVHRIRMILGGGMKRMGSPLGPIFPKGIATLQYMVAPSKFLGYYAAVDYAVEGRMRGQLTDSLHVAVSPWRAPYVATYAGVELSLGRMHASFGVGAYVLRPVTLRGRLCERLRLSFLLTERMRAVVGIMAHSFTADFIELGVQLDLLRWGMRKD